MNRIYWITPILFAACFCVVNCSYKSTRSSKKQDKQELAAARKRCFEQLIYQRDLYSGKATPEEFLLFLKDPGCDDLYEYAIDPDSIPVDWVKKTDVIALSNYLDDPGECVKVVPMAILNTLSNRSYSRVNEEALKLINCYFAGRYVIFGSSPRSYSKEEVLEWVRLNR